jgi:hypothetical protein
VPSMQRHIQFEIYVDFLSKIVESDAWELILKAMKQTEIGMLILYPGIKSREISFFLRVTLALG